MKGTRFYKIIIALLVVINLGTILFMWLGNPAHPPRPGEGPKLSEMIGLTGDAKLKVDELEKEHHKDKQLLMKLDSELHKEMFALVGSDENPIEVQTRLNANKEEVERMTYDFFNDVAAQCNQEQKKTLHEFIEDRLVRRGPRPPRK
jgi:hypothetical protein